jgi:hypothetical protein
MLHIPGDCSVGVVAVGAVDATFACGAGVCDRDDLSNVIIVKVISYS